MSAAAALLPAPVPPPPPFPVDVRVLTWHPTAAGRTKRGYATVSLPDLGMVFKDVSIYADDLSAWALIPDRVARGDPNGYKPVCWFPDLAHRASFDAAVIAALRVAYPAALPPANSAGGIAPRYER